MKQSYGIVGALFILSLNCPSPQGEAAELKITGKFSGSIVTTGLDVDNNGVPSVMSMVRGKSSMGMTSAQTIGENAPRLPTVTTCPPNNWEFPLLMAYAIMHFDDTGDLLFATYSAGVTCVDLSTGMFSTKGTGRFTGGTGSLTNATGSFEVTSHGKGMVRDRAGHEFDYLVDEFTGMLITP